MFCIITYLFYFLCLSNLSKIIRFARNYKLVNLSLSMKGNQHVVLTARREVPLLLKKILLFESSTAKKKTVHKTLQNDEFAMI